MIQNKENNTFKTHDGSSCILPLYRLGDFILENWSYLSILFNSRKLTVAAYCIKVLTNITFACVFTKTTNSRMKTIFLLIDRAFHYNSLNDYSTGQSTNRTLKPVGRLEIWYSANVAKIN